MIGRAMAMIAYHIVSMVFLNVTMLDAPLWSRIVVNLLWLGMSVTLFGMSILGASMLAGIIQVTRLGGTVTFRDEKGKLATRVVRPDGTEVMKPNGR